MFKKFLILINQKKEHFNLEKKANEFLNSEMYELYAQMVGNGYQPNDKQKTKISFFF